MEDNDIGELTAELVRLVDRQIEALELDEVVGLTDAEWRQYSERNERIRELNGKLDNVTTTHGLRGLNTEPGVRLAGAG